MSHFLYKFVKRGEVESFVPRTNFYIHHCGSSNFCTSFSHIHALVRGLKGLFQLILSITDFLCFLLIASHCSYLSQEILFTLTRHVTLQLCILKSIQFILSLTNRQCFPPSVLSFLFSVDKLPIIVNTYNYNEMFYVVISPQSLNILMLSRPFSRLRLISFLHSGVISATTIRFIHGRIIYL